MIWMTFRPMKMPAKMPGNTSRFTFSDCSLTKSKLATNGSLMRFTNRKHRAPTPRKVSLAIFSTSA